MLAVMLIIVVMLAYRIIVINRTERTQVVKDVVLLHIVAASTILFYAMTILNINETFALVSYGLDGESNWHTSGRAAACSTISSSSKAGTAKNFKKRLTNGKKLGILMVVKESSWQASNACLCGVSTVIKL